MTGSSPDPSAPSRRTFLRRALFAGAGLMLPLAWPRRAESATTLGTMARAWRAMGTLVEVKIPDLPHADAIEAVGRVRREVERLEAAMTLFRAESPLVALNGAPEGRWVALPGELAQGLSAAAAAYRITDGAFDPTLARRMRELGLHEPNAGRLVEAAPEYRSGPGPGALELDPGNRRARRLDARVEFDLGGIGKGLAVDAALAVLADAGSIAALVNLGGSIGVLGAPEDAPEGWPVGIVDARRPGAVAHTVTLSRGHLATSGDYERFVDAPEGRRHHLLDPRSGAPAPGVASVTVWAESGVDADVASTESFVRLGRGVRPRRPRWWASQEAAPGGAPVLHESGSIPRAGR